MNATERESRLRLFVALELPRSWQAYVAEVQGDVGRVSPSGLRWVRPELVHLTLVFLAEHPARELVAIQAAVSRVARQIHPFRLEIGALGTFGSRGSVNVLWAAVGDPSLRLNLLQRALVEELTRSEVTFDERQFRPHMTLARAQQRDDAEAAARIRAVLAALPRTRRPAGFPVRQIALFRSQLFPSGPLYTVLSEHLFSSADTKDVGNAPGQPS